MARNLKVVADGNSPTGYMIIGASGHGIYATTYEIQLWEMYAKAVKRIRCLQIALDRANQGKVVKINESKNTG